MLSAVSTRSDQNEYLQEHPLAERTRQICQSTPLVLQVPLHQVRVQEAEDRDLEPQAPSCLHRRRTYRFRGPIDSVLLICKLQLGRRQPKRAYRCAVFLVSDGLKGALCEERLIPCDLKYITNSLDPRELTTPITLWFFRLTLYVWPVDKAI
jgi:hypothetical protein